MITRTRSSVSLYVHGVSCSGIVVFRGIVTNSGIITVPADPAVRRSGPPRTHRMLLTFDVGFFRLDSVLLRWYEF
jgi:hypothetical protein